jgi:hypothetical protein
LKVTGRLSVRQDHARSCVRARASPARPRARGNWVHACGVSRWNNGGPRAGKVSASAGGRGRAGRRRTRETRPRAQIFVQNDILHKSTAWTLTQTRVAMLHELQAFQYASKPLAATPVKTAALPRRAAGGVQKVQRRPQQQHPEYPHERLNSGVTEARKLIALREIGQAFADPPRTSTNSPRAAVPCPTQSRGRSQRPRDLGQSSPSGALRRGGRFHASTDVPPRPALPRSPQPLPRHRRVRKCFANAQIGTAPNRA